MTQQRPNPTGPPAATPAAGIRAAAATAPQVRIPRIAVLPGDGIGPEVTAAALQVLQAAGFRSQTSTHAVGWQEWCRAGEALPAATLSACRDSDAVLFGAITSQPEDVAQAALPDHLRGKVTYRSPILRLRRELDLFANVRPALGPGIDVVIFRENTEGLYAGYEAHPVPEALAAIFPGLPTGPTAAVSLRVVTERGMRRICEAAFAFATANQRSKVTLAEKANVLRATGGLARRVYYEVAKQYPGIETEELHVDAACARLVRTPASFDVIVATNLFGDILSDIAAELAGGIGVAPSANLGQLHALFEPVHGSAPDIAGRGLADPTGAIVAAAMMARHVGQPDVAARIEAAVAALPRERPSTQAVLDAVLRSLLLHDVGLPA